ncbi:DUF4232 domain-containing protein [Rhodococcus sp. 05-2254-4]|nr:DUF4232 domain-containing protein [Rhodococcus sp. 05-2254-4]OZE40823.1 DUF4232 domain-containing protein [Rhodococcus sp. 05-2254-3]OZE45814.1 DUF4232 domain-containing protein [Rhodococcus sp. 05-2254-2]OZF52612.1 DUF4232 domain-containing protein [Rhodococcus sp. 14-1411-2a]
MHADHQRAPHHRPSHGHSPDSLSSADEQETTVNRIGTFSAFGIVGLIALTGCTTAETAPADTATTASTSAAPQPVPGEVSGTDPAGGADSDGAQSDGTATGGGDGAGGAAVPACTAADITPALGDITPSDVQTTVPLRYTNSGSVPCNVTGFPGATLQGPDVDGLGPDYDLARSEITPSTTITLEPGAAAVAELTLGTVNKNDERAWIPSAFLTTAPGDTTVMTLPFPASVGVQRQDGATRPASYIGAFSGPVY